MVEEVNACDREQKRINDFKSDMDSLLQEKMSHVEELRQIHSDINVVSGNFDCNCFPNFYIL